MSGAVSEYLQAGIKPRVMVVDDEECIRETISELLASEDIGVITAVGADECLQLLRAGFRGVILMDVMMPGKDGWSTIRDMEQTGLLQGNVITMLTAMDVPDERMEGLQEFVIDYITKPFDPAGFITSVRNYLIIIDQLQEAK